jgi:hypothetical protein
LWNETQALGGVGRFPVQNVFRGNPGVSSLAQRKIDEDAACSAFLLLFDEFVIRRTLRCTKTKYEHKTGSSDWNLSREEL